MFKHPVKQFVLVCGTIATLAAVPLISSAPAQANFVRAGAEMLRQLARPEVKLNLSAHKKVVTLDQKGQERVTWEPLEGKAVVQPSDVLRYSLTGNNQGDRPARGLVLNQAIPAQMTYVLNSAQSDAGLKVTYSIDNGKTFVAQPMIKVKQADGTVVEKPAPAEVYSHIRWEAKDDVSPSSQLMASYEVTVR